MKIKTALPELNENQYSMLYRIIENILGEKVDTQAHVSRGERSLAKDGFAINSNIDEQYKRARAVFNIPEPVKPDNAWWKQKA